MSSTAFVATVAAVAGTWANHAKPAAHRVVGSKNRNKRAQKARRAARKKQR